MSERHRVLEVRRLHGIEDIPVLLTSHRVTIHILLLREEDAAHLLRLESSGILLASFRRNNLNVAMAR